MPMKDILLTFLVAMVPVVELRGAIPFGVVRGLNIWTAILASVLGNLVPVPFIILFIRRIFAWMRAHMPKLDGLVTRMEKKAEKNRAAVEKYAFWGLAILVAIPLPGTGAWTGALVAAMMEMRLKRAFPAFVAGDYKVIFPRQPSCARCAYSAGSAGYKHGFFHASSVIAFSVFRFALYPVGAFPDRAAPACLLSGPAGRIYGRSKATLCRKTNCFT